MAERETMRGRCLFLRSDASKEIGAGHVIRSTALGNAWQKSGGTVTLIGYMDSPSLQERVRGEGFQYIPLHAFRSFVDDSAVLTQIIQTQTQTDCQDQPPWLVLDGYHFDTDYQSYVRSLGFRLCVIDDTAHLNRYDADLLLNQNVHADTLVYHCQEKTVRLLGPRFAMLRKQFLEHKQAKRPISAIGRRVLVTFGGVDIYRQADKVMEGLQFITSLRLDVTIVAGFENAGSADLVSAAEKLAPQHTIAIRHNVGNMYDLMKDVDVAICAAGSTTSELAFLGIPMLLIAIADNQLGIMNGFHRGGAARALGWYEGVTALDIANHLEELVFDPATRAAMGNAGQRLVDGLGCERIISSFIRDRVGEE